MDAYDAVVLGGGYAGLICATRLAGRTKTTGMRIALVNQTPRFVERLRLHERIAEPLWTAAPRLPPLADFLAAAGVDFVEADVTGIDRKSRAVTIEALSGPRTLGYTRLVIALGSKIDRGSIAGVAEHAFVLDPDGPRSQPELKRRLAALGPAERRFVVIGGGPTGIEVAAELAVLEGARVRLVDAGSFAAFATQAVRRRLREAVQRAGVEIVEDSPARAVESDRVLTHDRELACDLCVWCGGFRGSDLVLESGLATNRQGRVLTDPFLRALNDPKVFVAGDACLPVEWHGAPPRMSAFFALTTGAHVADTIAALHRGRQPRPFGYWSWGQAIAVGSEAVGFATIPYDRAIGPIYRRRTGFWLRWFFVWLLAKLPLMVRRFPRLPFWLGRHAYRRDVVRKYAVPHPVVEMPDDG